MIACGHAVMISRLVSLDDKPIHGRISRWNHEIGMTDAPSPSITSPDDRELLRRYVQLRDEAAFAELVRRKGPLVLGVCRRVLRSPQDIEDAFQATFMVLARDAGRIRRQDSLSSWLHGVAYRTSLRSVDSSRRHQRLLQEVTMTNHQADLPPNAALAEVELRCERQALDEELQSLDDKYRTPLVLHYIEGKTNQEVADEMSLSVSAVEGRLKRGKKELRLRLARRGIGLTVAIAAVHTMQSLAEAAPVDSLIARTIDAGLSYAGGQPPGPTFTPEAARLAGQEIVAMSTTTAVTLAAVIILPLALAIPGHSQDGPPDTSAGPVTTVIQAEQEEANLEQTVLAQRDNEKEEGRPAKGAVSEGGGFGIEAADGSSGAQLILDSPNGLTLQTQGVRYDKPSPSVVRIKTELDNETKVEFVDTPLADAVDFIATLHNITIMIDEQALSDLAIPLDEPITLTLSGVKLKSVLNQMLRRMELTTIIRDEVLTVTTQEVADEFLETQVYNVRHLGNMEAEQLVELLQSSIPGAEWDTTGGGGSATAIDGGLVVKQTQATHERIAHLLAQLQRHQAAGREAAVELSPPATTPLAKPAVTKTYTPRTDSQLIIYKIEDLVESMISLSDAGEEDEMFVLESREELVRQISSIVEASAMRATVEFDLSSLDGTTFAITSDPEGHRAVEEVLKTLREYAETNDVKLKLSRPFDGGGGGGGFFSVPPE